MNEFGIIPEIIAPLDTLIDNTSLLGATNDIDAIAIWLREYKELHFQANRNKFRK